MLAKCGDKKIFVISLRSIIAEWTGRMCKLYTERQPTGVELWLPGFQVTVFETSTVRSEHLSSTFWCCHKVCVTLASHLPKPHSPFLLSSIPFSSPLLIPGSLFVFQFPRVFLCNLLARLLLPVLFSPGALCPSASLSLPLNSLLAWVSTRPAPTPPFLPLFLLSAVLPLSVWLSSVIKRRPADADRMWGQTRRGSEGVWAAQKQRR